MTIKKKKDDYLHLVQFAYYRGRWVNVPMFYVPRNALGEDGYLHQFQLIPVDGEKLPDSPPRRSCEEAFKFINKNTKETILPWMLSGDEVKELCTANDIPISWVTGLQRKVLKKTNIEKSSRRSDRKYCFLKKSEYDKFISRLKKINFQAAVIAEILWFLNRELQPGDDYITLEEVLRMKMNDVDPEDGITTCIHLFRTTSHGSHMVSHLLPEYIWQPLCNLIKNDSLFVFTNQDYGQLLPSDVSRFFKKAGKQAKIKKTVCSLSLRPIGKFKKTKPNYCESKYSEVSIEEWENICLQVPEIKKRRGAPSQHDPRHVLNGILYHLRTETPIRKLPHSYPPFRAVHSLYRRWLINGVFESILSARKINSEFGDKLSIIHMFI